VQHPVSWEISWWIKKEWQWTGNVCWTNARRSDLFNTASRPWQLHLSHFDSFSACDTHTLHLVRPQVFARQSCHVPTLTVTNQRVSNICPQARIGPARHFYPAREAFLALKFNGQLPCFTVVNSPRRTREQSLTTVSATAVMARQTDCVLITRASKLCMGHWSRTSVVYPRTGSWPKKGSLWPKKGRRAPRLYSRWGMAHFYFTYQ